MLLIKLRAQVVQQQHHPRTPIGHELRLGQQQRGGQHLLLAPGQPPFNSGTVLQHLQITAVGTAAGDPHGHVALTSALVVIDQPRIAAPATVIA